MISKTQARTKAASVKATLDELEARISALPETQEKADLQSTAERLHRKLNGLARRAAEIFETDVETFSGGTDKPDED